MTRKGFTLVEILVGSALMLLMFSGILGVYMFSLQVVSQSQYRVVSTALANQKIEIIRNLPYNDVGTIGGVPAGALTQTETVLQNESQYVIQTTVVFIDDPYDGLSPVDILPTDYKRVKVRVSWQGRFGGEVALLTDVAPRGVETAAGGGTLALSVFNAMGAGVGQANARIVNSDVFPPIDATYQTDDYGNLILPGVPASAEQYAIFVSKTGYSGERTYARNETVGSAILANPSHVHASVFEGQVTNTSFSIDTLGTLSLDMATIEDGQTYAVPYVAFTAQGAKTLGTNEDGEPVLKYIQQYSTNGSGHIDIPDTEWDSYSFLVDKASTGLDLLSSDPVWPVNLLPGAVQPVALNVKAEHTLLVTARDALGENPIFGAQVRLYNAGYDAIQPTDEEGKTFFIPLEEDSYTLVADMTGYQQETAQISIAGAAAQIIYLTPNE